MNDFWIIYFLSISESFSDVLRTLGYWMFFAPGVAYAVAMVAYAITIDGAGSRKEEIRDRRDSVEKKMRSYIFKIAPLGAAMLIGSSLLPSPRRVIQAYALIEGSKVVNAVNAEAAAKDFSAKIDKLIEAVGAKE